MFLRNSRPRQVFHPVPIALGEICKLCQIDHPHGVGDRELVGQTPRIAASALAPANANPLSAVGDSAARTVRGSGEFVSALLVKSLRRPDFELLRPSVVIRRRPKRP